MPVTGERSLEEEVISILRAVSGAKAIAADQMVGRDVGIDGLDGIEVVEQLEEEFGVDLRPLIEAHLIAPRRNWLDRLLGRGFPHADVTVRELIDYIASRTQREAR